MEDNSIPEFMKINRRIMIMHNHLSDMMDDLTELQQDVEFLYSEAGVILDIIDGYMEKEKYNNKLEKPTKSPPKPMPSIVSDLRGVYRQRKGESHEAFRARLYTSDYDERY